MFYSLVENAITTIREHLDSVRTFSDVRDAVRAYWLLLEMCPPGEVYNIGSGNERNNLEVTKLILKIMGKNEDMIEYVKDRPGHDLRYSLDCSRLRKLGWKPEHSFDLAMHNTVRWYRENRWWWEKLKH